MIKIRVGEITTSIHRQVGQVPEGPRAVWIPGGGRRVLSLRSGGWSGVCFYEVFQIIPKDSQAWERVDLIG